METHMKANFTPNQMKTVKIGASHGIGGFMGSFMVIALDASLPVDNYLYYLMISVLGNICAFSLMLGIIIPSLPLLAKLKLNKRNARAAKRIQIILVGSVLFLLVTAIPLFWIQQYWHCCNNILFAFLLIYSYFVLKGSWNALCNDEE